MVTPESSQPIIAVTGESDRYSAIRSRAETLAAETGGAVILYDIDAAEVFASPVPTAWSGDGERELTEDETTRDRLDVDALEAAGRGLLADQVRALRRTGIDAWAWLPTSKDVADLEAYARRQGASVVLVPPDLVQPGLLDRVLGTDEAAVVEATSTVRFETIAG